MNLELDYDEIPEHLREYFEPISGPKQKDLYGIPWRVAFALQADRWYLRSEIIWAKKNCMPESVTDRPTKAHEQVFLLSKKPRYWYDTDAIKEPLANSSIQRINQSNFDNQTGGPKDYRNGINANRSARNTLENLKKSGNQGRNARTVWSIATVPFKGAHFAVMPPALARRCILAGCPSRVCVECGEPWVRVVEKIPVPRDITSHRGKSNWAMGAKKRNDTDLTRSGQEAIKWKAENPDKFLGFTPTCQCCPLPARAASHRPGIVLDPFGGSGTVAKVAIETGRDWLLIDLNPEYVKLAQARIKGAQPVLFPHD